MLDNSLQLFSGISPKKEASLWRQGITTWNAFERHASPQLSLLTDDVPKESLWLTQVREAREAARAKDCAFFFRRLNRAEHYRIALSFPDDCLFLDIETTGLSRYYDQITVIGWRLGGRHGFYIQGQSDLEFRAAVLAAKCVITFNGTLFDLPFIRQSFPEIQFPEVHIDLRFLARRVELVGGQKKIEASIGLARQDLVKGMSGELAPVLWHQYIRGDIRALETLLIYNLADIDGMCAIFEHVARALRERSGLPTSAEHIDAAFSRMRPLQSMDSSALISRHLIPYPKTEEKILRLEDVVFVDRPPRLKVVGIDLTGSEERASGWCLLDGREAVTSRLHTDEEIIAITLRERPHLVSIDSPLSLPEGRIRVEDDDPGRAEFGIMRYCERILKRRGVNVYPALLPSMQRLTARGIALAAKLRQSGLPVIESYPGAAQDIMRIPRKRKGLEYLEEGLAAFGVSGTYIKGGVSHDELDAITSAIVGVFFWAGMMERLGPDPLGDEALIIPDLRIDAAAYRNRIAIGLSGPLGAGKTTAARFFESLNYKYCRYSQVIETLVAKRKRSYSRKDLQAEGDRVHRTKGQRWLGRELIRSMLDEQFIVIDGLRFPEDHAFLVEVFGSQFVHVHVVAPVDVRRKRFGVRENSVDQFDQQESHVVESQTQKMEVLARDIVANHGSLEGYFNALNEIAHRDWRY